MTVQTVPRLEDLPEPVPDADFVVVDVITASTSIVGLLDAGAQYVRPFADADAARAFGRETEGAVLVGEENGTPVEGFDLLPLPSTFASADLEGRPVGIYTTNGTRAVDRIGGQDGLFIGSSVNAAAVASRLAERGRETWLVAAGYHGSETPEDTAGVELIAHHYRRLTGDGATDDLTPATLREQIRESPPATWLRQLGFGADIDAIADLDSTETVPRLRDGVFVTE
jgi:2-phosphosulfolactate phosphatase